MHDTDDPTNIDPTPRYPEIEVKLIGRDGNAFAILGAVSRGLHRAGKGDQIDAFIDEATAGDYGQLLATCERWVTVY